MLSSLKTILDTLGIPVAYHHFNTKTPLPYLVYYEDGSDNLYADNKVLSTGMQVEIELYTEFKDITLEGQLETLLNNNELPYEKINETYIDSETMYEIVYRIFLYE